MNNQYFDNSIASETVKIPLGFYVLEFLLIAACIVDVAVSILFRNEPKFQPSTQSETKPQEDTETAKPEGAK
jgi:hypothetical protein